MAKLLIVDDEKSIREALLQVFEYEGHEVRGAEDGATCLKLNESFRPDVIFLDVKMPGMDGLETLEKLREQEPGVLVVMISGHGTIDTAVEATRKGAYDFLEKPLDTGRLLVTLRRALELRGLTASMEAAGPGGEPVRDRGVVVRDPAGAGAGGQGGAHRRPRPRHR
jgi:two-component system nitrogen regulation response regulator NtrX